MKMDNTAEPKLLHHKSLSILRTFSDVEFVNFKEFIKQPYSFINETFTDKEKYAINRFLDEISDFHPLYDDKFKKKYLKKGSETKIKSTINELLAKLYPLCKKYLIQIFYENKTFSKEIALILEYEKRNINRLEYFALIEELKNKMNSIENFDFSNYKFRCIIDESIHDFEVLTDEYKNEQQLLSTTKLQSDSGNNSIFYFIYKSINKITDFYSKSNKVEYETAEFSFYENFKKIFPEENIVFFFNQMKNGTIYEEHKKILELMEILYFMHIRGYDYIEFNLLNAGNLLLESTNYLSKESKYHLYTTFIRVMWQVVVKNPAPFENMEFDIYKSYFANNAYKMDNKKFLTLYEFKHFLMRTVSAGRFDFGELLIKEYIKALPVKYHNIMQDFFKAYYYLKNRDKMKKEYLIQILKTFNTYVKNEFYIPKYYIIKRDIDLLSAILSFEIGEFSLSRKAIQSLKDFLKNHNPSSTQKEPFKLFINYLKKLILIEGRNISKEQKKENLVLLKKTIKTQQNKKVAIAGGSWFIIKIDELVKN